MSATGNPAADIAAVTQRFLQFFANRDFAGLASCYTEDAQMLVANMDVITGRSAIASVFKFTAVSGHDDALFVGVAGRVAIHADPSVAPSGAGASARWQHTSEHLATTSLGVEVLRDSLGSSARGVLGIDF